MSGLKLENVRNEEFAIARVLIQTNGIIAFDPFDPIMCIEAKIYTTCQVIGTKRCHHLVKYVVEHEYEKCCTASNNLPQWSSFYILSSMYLVK